ncbi:MAG TPA: hypothetical protein LFW20_07380, partial [Rickettsia endosymbiont of Omalisus fontisbellaquei]|nr:hypothetical protein [Rickettsia endosymbiont of Omalisus fontisbellaquei]
MQKEIGYIRSNSATIDHNINDQVLQKIIDTHPDINSKEQAVRWIQTHGMEAGNIAREIIDPVNKIG